MPIQGKELLSRLKDLDHLNKSEKARACGYVTQLPNEKERVNLREFMNALLEAKGIRLEGDEAEKRGRKLSYRTKILSNGTVLIGAAYTRQMNLNPGDRFEIKLGRTSIKLTAIDSEQSDAAEFEDFVHDNEDFDDDEID